MQLINEVPLEEEEGESQDVTQSRKLQGQVPHQYSHQSNQHQFQQEGTEEEMTEEQAEYEDDGI